MNEAVPDLHPSSTPPSSATLAPFRLAVYSDAEARGGAEVTLSHLLHGLPEQVHVTIVGVDPEVVDWLVERRPGSAALVLEPIRSRSDVAQLWAHARAFRRIRPDLIQFNLSMASSCQWAMFVATLARHRSLVVENSPMGTWSATSTRLKRFTSSRSAAHVAVGERTARLIESDSGLPVGSVDTLYHGVPDVAQGVAPEAITGSTLLNIARHDPVKGLDILLQAMTLLPEGVRLVQIGRGSETASLLALRDELGLVDRVEFRDLPWEINASDLIGGFDVFVLPSRLEGLPVSIMEAMLAGIAIVASDVGSVDEEITDGVTGRLVPPEDPEALANVLGEVLSDDAARRSMGEQARAVALEKFTVAATVEQYCRIYQRVLAG